MSKFEVPYKIYLEENEIPSSWYNVRADMKNKPAPLLNPGTHKPRIPGQQNLRNLCNTTGFLTRYHLSCCFTPKTKADGILQ